MAAKKTTTRGKPKLRTNGEAKKPTGGSIGNGKETRFQKGNKANEKYNLEEAKALFSDMLDFTYDNDEILSSQQSYLDFGIHPATYYHLINRFPELEKFKKGINDIIVARINNKALKNEFNATSSIWRCKQLGERDEKTLDHKGKIDGNQVTVFQLPDNGRE